MGIGTPLSSNITFINDWFLVEKTINLQLKSVSNLRYLFNQIIGFYRDP